MHRKGRSLCRDVRVRVQAKDSSFVLELDFKLGSGQGRSQDAGLVQGRSLDQRQWQGEGRAKFIFDALWPSTQTRPMFETQVTVAQARQVLRRVQLTP